MTRETRGVLAAALGAALLAGALMTGCGAPGTSPADADGSTSTSPPSTTSSPTAACPQPVEGELPEYCVAYDPEELMEGNEEYRQRHDLPDDVATAAEALVPAVTEALEQLRLAGPATEDDVRAALESLGLASVQTRSGAGIAFGAAAPEGGCVFGAVEADAVTVEVGGVIMDGGCLPAQ
ncbi:hypothetical protein OCAE111667_26700 [Occultella aeris]|uniref:Lipoprotein n=1 Tax=Occultella aeris TaxID=2761496 RepID=A0A7M4DHD0_9MICO|nr:hypothetical protein [Occultella aeris]VZO36323.1 hypothetical protein HALOF300_01527 [Occultella aeris]